MKFTHTAQLADPPDLVMARLLEGGSDTSAWELANDGSQVRLHAERPVGRSSAGVNTETVVTVEPSQAGTKLTMTASLTISRRAELLLRPWAAHRVREVFAQLVRSLETGAPMSRDENWRAGARAKLRIRTVALIIQLLLGAVAVAFFALVAWPIAVLFAVMFVSVAVRPWRRLAAARDRIAKPLAGDRPVNTDKHA